VERAAKVAEKERQKAARDAEKAIQLSQVGKCKASKPRKRQKRVVVDSSRWWSCTSSSYKDHPPRPQNSTTK
jgi:hypothetical protein